MTTLLINAHPSYTSTETTTHALIECFMTQYRAAFPEAPLTVLNLHETQVPRIEAGQLTTIWDKSDSGIALSPEEAAIAERSDDLLEQFKAHDHIVIASPLNNFNITSRLKDYIDNILIAKETFAYTDTGSVGLMQGHQALFLQASGCIYTDGGQYASCDHSYQYLKSIFENIMAFDSFAIVRAEGTDVNDRETILKHSAADLVNVFADFYA